MGTLQIFPNHGKSILATDSMTLEAEELNSGEAAWANLARRLRRDKSGGTYDKSIFVEASCPRFAAPIAPDWPLADLP